MIKRPESAKSSLNWLMKVTSLFSNLHLVDMIIKYKCILMAVKPNVHLMANILNSVSVFVSSSLALMPVKSNLL